jgi:hypothetical protein
MHGSGVSSRSGLLARCRPRCRPRIGRVRCWTDACWERPAQTGHTRSGPRGVVKVSEILDRLRRLPLRDQLTVLTVGVAELDAPLGARQIGVVQEATSSSLAPPNVS